MLKLSLTAMRIPRKGLVVVVCEETRLGTAIILFIVEVLKPVSGR